MNNSHDLLWPRLVQALCQQKEKTIPAPEPRKFTGQIAIVLKYLCDNGKATPLTISKKTKLYLSQVHNRLSQLKNAGFARPADGRNINKSEAGTASYRVWEATQQTHSQEERIIACLRSLGQATISIISDETKLHTTAVQKKIQKLQSEGLVRDTGKEAKDRNRHYHKIWEAC